MHECVHNLHYAFAAQAARNVMLKRQSVGRWTKNDYLFICMYNCLRVWQHEHYKICPSQDISSEKKKKP